MLLVLLACTGPYRDGNSTDSVDTGGPIEIVEQPGLTRGGVLTCADPGMRETSGPMFLPDLGADWASQKSDTSSAGAAVEDFNGDGLLDIFLSDHDRCQLYITQPDGTLTEESAERLPADCAGMGAAPADIDADGDIDIFVTATSDPELLLINDGVGTFTDEATARGLTVEEADPSMGASWGDLDADGDLDLFIANHTFRGGTGPTPPDPAYANRLMRNDGDGSFSAISATLPDSALLGYTFLGSWHDFNMDGHTDLYIINDYGDQVYENRLLLGDGSGGLTDADPDNGLNLPIDAMGLGVGDFNGDGLPDAVVSDWGSMHLMLSLEAGIWYDSTLASGLTATHSDTVIGWGVEFADPDNDADLDIIATFGPASVFESNTLDNPDNPDNPEIQPDGFWRNDGGTLTDAAADWGLDHTGNNRGLIVADLNGDGWLDTLRRGIKEGTSVIHHSRCGAEAWVTVRLEAAGENPAAIGARIVLEAGGDEQVRWIGSGSTGLSSGGPLMAHFGLNDATILDHLTVHWPDGTTNSFTNIETRQALVINQADSE